VCSMLVTRARTLPNVLQTHGLRRTLFFKSRFFEQINKHEEKSNLEPMPSMDSATLLWAKKLLLEEISVVYKEGFGDEPSKYDTEVIKKIDALVKERDQNKKTQEARDFVRKMKTIRMYLDLPREEKIRMFGRVNNNLEAELEELDERSKGIQMERVTFEKRLRDMGASTKGLIDPIVQFKKISRQLAKDMEQLEQKFKQKIGHQYPNHSLSLEKIQRKIDDVEFKFVVGGDSRFAKASFVNHFLKQKIFPLDASNLKEWRVIVELKYKEDSEDIEWIAETQDGSKNHVESDRIHTFLASDGLKRIHGYIDAPLLKDGLKIVMLNVHKNHSAEETQWMLEEVQQSCAQIFVLHLEDAKENEKIMTLGRKVGQLLLHTDMERTFLVVSDSGQNEEKTKLQMKKFQNWFVEARFPFDENFRDAYNISVLDLNKELSSDDESFNTVVGKLVPYVGIWSQTKKNELLRLIQQEMAKNLKYVFAGRKEWERLRFQEIYLAEEFQRNLHMIRGEIIMKLRDKAKKHQWEVAGDDLLNEAFRQRKLSMEEREAMLGEVVVKHFNSLMDEYVDRPSASLLEMITAEWSALFSNNLHFESFSKQVDFSPVLKESPFLPEKAFVLFELAGKLRHLIAHSESELSTFKKQKWEVLLNSVVKKEVENRFDALLQKTEEILESMKDSRDSEGDTKIPLQVVNELVKLSYEHFEHFWSESYFLHDGDLLEKDFRKRFCDGATCKNFTQKFHSPTDPLFRQSCQELFALILCGMFPRIPWLGSVVGIRKTEGGELEFVSDSETKQYTLLADAWGKVHEIDDKMKKELILQLLSICCHLREIGLSLSSITPENLAVDLETMSLRLISLKGAEFVGGSSFFYRFRSDCLNSELGKRKDV
jgi:hypothetical protein